MSNILYVRSSANSGAWEGIRLSERQPARKKDLHEGLRKKRVGEASITLGRPVLTHSPTLLFLYTLIYPDLILHCDVLIFFAFSAPEPKESWLTDQRTQSHIQPTLTPGFRRWKHWGLGEWQSVVHESQASEEVSTVDIKLRVEST